MGVFEPIEFFLIFPKNLLLLDKMSGYKKYKLYFLDFKYSWGKHSEKFQLSSSNYLGITAFQRFKRKIINDLVNLAAMTLYVKQPELQRVNRVQ